VKNVILVLVLVCLVVVSVLYVRSQRLQPRVASSGDANNLKHVKCKQQLGGGPVEIPVDATTLIDRDDQIVFVCKNELVHWTIADSNVRTFTVTFKNNVWPFGPNPMPLSPQTGGATLDQTVAGVTGKYAQAYEYTIAVTRTDGTSASIDPHVIPMGP
jgi:hypothetical protein